MADFKNVSGNGPDLREEVMDIVSRVHHLAIDIDPVHAWGCILSQRTDEFMIHQRKQKGTVNRFRIAGMVRQMQRCGYYEEVSFDSLCKLMFGDEYRMYSRHCSRYEYHDDLTLFEQFVAA